MANRQIVHFSEAEKTEILEKILRSLEAGRPIISLKQLVSGDIEGDLYWSQLKFNDAEINYCCGLVSEYHNVPHSTLHTGWTSYSRVGISWDNNTCVFDIEKYETPLHTIFHQILERMKAQYRSNSNVVKRSLFDHDRNGEGETRSDRQILEDDIEELEIKFAKYLEKHPEITPEVARQLFLSEWL